MTLFFSTAIIEISFVYTEDTRGGEKGLCRFSPPGTNAEGLLLKEIGMENFKRDFELILKSDFGREVGEASVKELYNAVSKAVMLDIYDDWRKSRESGRASLRIYVGGVFDRKNDLFESFKSRRYRRG